MKTNQLILGVVALLALGIFTGYINPGATGGAAGAASGRTGDINLPLGTSQTLPIFLYDADKGTTAITAATLTGYLGTPTIGANGVPDFSVVTAPGNKVGVGSSTGLTTTPKTTVTVISEKPDWFAAYGTITTNGEATSAPPLAIRHEAVDTSLNISVLQNDETTVAYTPNPVAIAAATPYSFVLAITPSALYKHVGGPLNKYTVSINSTNASTTSWNAGGFSLQGLDGQACVASTQPSAPIGGSLVKQFDCGGDTSGLVVGRIKLPFTVKTGSATPGVGNHSVCLTGWTVFNHSITGTPTYGAFKDDGTATLITPICGKFSTS